MQIDNGITDRERAEVLAALEKMYDDATEATEKAFGKEEQTYHQGQRRMIERVINYLENRW